jgi:hypothetical protein
VIHSIEIIRDLLAKKALGERVLGVATQLDRAAVVDGDDESARVGTIVRANGVDSGQ